MLTQLENQNDDNIDQQMTLRGLDYNGTEADTEWSDVTDEGHHSDHSQLSEGSKCKSTKRKLHQKSQINKSHPTSPTRLQISADDLCAMSRHKSSPSHRRAYTVGHAAVITHPDPADIIMDNIDTELYKLVKVKPQKKSRRLSDQQREMLRLEGVEFDSGDETVTCTQSLAKLRSRSKSPGDVKSSSVAGAGDERDTGLGSVDDPGSTTEGDATPRQIIGKADVYSGAHTDTSEDEDHKASYAEMDSDCAQQLNEKYKMIMKTKKGPGDTLKDFRVSEQGSIKTEDFENKFQEMCVPPVPKPRPDRTLSKKCRNADSLTDLESIKTEDIEREYHKTVAKASFANPARYNTGFHYPGKCRKRSSHRKELTSQKQQHQTVATKPPRSRSAKHSAALVAMATPTKRKKSRGQGHRPMASHMHQTPSDIESIQTEDFENHFKTMMVKQVANVPITNFDQFMVDSDLDTVRSQVIREKFLTALRRAEKDKSFGGESDVSTDNESVKIDALVEQKIQEILRKVKQNSADYSDMESVRAFQGSPQFHHIEEESEDEEEEEPVYTRSRSSKVKRSSRRSPNIQRRKQPVYEDDLELGDEAREIERQSAKIRAEMESEGWRSPSTSPQRSRTPTLGRPGRRSPTPRSPSAPPREVDSSLKLRDDVSKLQLEVIRSKQERQSVQKELEKLSSTLKDHRQELRASEKQIKDNRKKAEDVRSELMLTEFKRDSARKDLERVNDEVKRRRDELDLYTSTATPGETQHGDETSDGNTTDGVYARLKDLSVSKIEFAKMLAEREDLQTKLKKADLTEREKQELDKQLTTSKEALLNEQKAARQREEALREDLDNSEAQLSDVTRERDTLKNQLDHIQQRLHQTEADRDKKLSERREECEELKTRMTEELARIRNDNSRDLAEVRRQAAESVDRLTRAESELGAKDDLNNALREQLAGLQNRLTEETEQKGAIKAQSEDRHRQLVQEKEKALAQLQKYTDEEKQLALDDLHEQLEHQNQMVLDQAEHRFTQELTDLQSKLTARELELEVVRDKLKQQEAMGKQIADKIRSEANMKFRQLVQEERTRWEEDKEREISTQLTVLRDEMDKTAKQLRDELSSERQLVDNQLQQIMELKKELEGAKLQSRQAIRAKINAMSQAKETAVIEKEKQMDIYRERIEEESHRTLERLRDSTRRLEEDVDRLQRENKELRTRQTEANNTSDSQERALLTDMNEECRKVAAILGTTPRVVTFTSLNNWPSPGGKGKMPMKAALGTALANLKASNEDLRNYAKELKQELDGVKQSLKAAEKSKKESIDVLKQKMQKEKLQALETLKDRLIKEHLEEVDKLHKSLGKGKTMHKALRQKDTELQEIQENMKKWKNQTTEKLATQFQEEMARELEKRLKEYKRQQKDWERERLSQQRQLDRLERELAKCHPVMDKLNLTTNNHKTFGTPLKAPPPPADSEAARTMKELQGRVKQLSADNASLRRGNNKLSTSTPDLQAALSAATPTKQHPKKDEHAVKQLEIQLQRAEHRAQLAEDRASKTDSLLNQKLLEMSKLQGTLTQQTKELMQLERAYSQIQQKAVPARPPSRTGLKP